MKTQIMKVGDLGIKAPLPETMKELEDFVGSPEDLFYLALRGFDQVRRTHLKQYSQRKGVTKAMVESRAQNYWYRHRKTFDPGTRT